MKPSCVNDFTESVVGKNQSRPFDVIGSMFKNYAFILESKFEQYSSAAQLHFNHMQVYNHWAEVNKMKAIGQKTNKAIVVHFGMNQVFGKL